MKTINVAAVLFVGIVLLGLQASGAEPIRVRRDGAFGFPQDKANVLYDQKELRVSVWNDNKVLYIQAVVWGDSDESTWKEGKYDFCGSSVVDLDVDADQKRSPNVDRKYHLNPWPDRRGLSYQVVVNEMNSTTLKYDSNGRGAIRYVDTAKGRVRVDSFAILLAEIGRKPGDKIRLAYWCRSPKPPRIPINSVGYEHKKDESYTINDIPYKKYHEITLADRPVSLNIAQVPEDRKLGKKK